MLQTHVITAGTERLEAILALPEAAKAVVIFAHGSGSSRLSPRNTLVARGLNEFGQATVLFDLLTETEAADRRNVFDIPLLGNRVMAGINWVRTRSELTDLPIGLFGASTGAAAALIAAAELPAQVAAVVSRGGRPDLAGEYLPAVVAPTLLIVGGLDEQVIELNRDAYRRISCKKKIEIVPGATHLFEEPGTLEQVVNLAGQWFDENLVSEAS